LEEKEDQRINHLVAEHVMGWTKKPMYLADKEGNSLYRWYAPNELVHLGLLPEYSTRIECAWQVVEKMRADAWDVLIDGTDDGSYDWWTVRFGGCMPAVQSTSIAKAICLAALKAKGVEVPS
jgi:hypothetical protein